MIPNNKQRHILKAIAEQQDQLNKIKHAILHNLNTQALEYTTRLHALSEIIYRLTYELEN